MPSELPAHKRPVLIRQGALGPDRPVRDVIVSPQHRILCGAPCQLHWLCAKESLVPARALLGLPRIRAMQGKRRIFWWHIVLPQHAVVLAEGMLTETLLPGPEVSRGLSAVERNALRQIGAATPVLPLVRPQKAARLLETQQARIRPARAGRRG